MKRLSLSLIRQLLYFVISCNKLYNKSYFTRPQGPCFLLAARQNEQAHSALAPQRRLKLLAGAQSAAYLAYVSICDTRQMPKEPC